MPASLRKAVLSASLVLAVACDDPKKTEPATASPASAAPAAAPAPSAALEHKPDVNPEAKKEPVKCEAGVVAFHQPGLEAEIRRKAAKPDGALTAADLAKVKSVNLTSAPAGDPDPCIFPMLKGVKDVFLNKGTFDDLSPLASLTQLATLVAPDNKVSDTKPLGKMSKMDRVDLSKTAITDLSFAASMPVLTELTVDDTAVTDLTPLSRCPQLEKLSIKNTQVRDLKPLLALKKLKMLWVGGSKVEDTTVLAPLVASSGLKMLAQ